MSHEKAAAGIDFGSRTIKIVQWHNGAIVSWEIHDTNPLNIEKTKEKLASSPFSRVVATGYGRHLLKKHFSNSTVTEIKACALGAKFVLPSCRLVIDIGGQDFKIIEVKENGVFGRFELNDRCAAGTGRFLEIMAQILGYRVEEFGREALKAPGSLRISSMCTVFAESEVISLMTSGEDRRSIALAVHHSVVERLFPLLSKFEIKGEIMLTGGVALNPCLVSLLSQKLGREIFVPPQPQIIPALGAAMIASSL